jgi:2,3-dihydroxybiphenyl 1,2-dioxygenase
MMSAVTELGYLGLSVSKLVAWKDYAAGLIGLEVFEENGDADRLFLRMDRWHHRIELVEDGGDDLLYLGWRVAGPVELDQMQDKLREAGLAVERGSSAEAASRHVLGLLRLRSPGGIATEIFYGPQVDNHKPFHPGRPMFGRFVTGEQGLGHVVVNEPDAEAAVRFYQLLGLRGSVEYFLSVPGGGQIALTFMKVNDRQHSIAFGVPNSPKQINHVMLEYSEMDDLGIAHDQVRARQIPIVKQLGKHANDAALSFYSVNPSGWLVELGWGGCKASAQQEHHRHDVFGHETTRQGFGIDFGRQQAPGRSVCDDRLNHRSS